MSLPTPIRTASVEGRPLAIFDALVPEADIARFAVLLGHAPFTRTEAARPDTLDYRHWASEMAVPGLLKLPLWGATDAAMQAFQPARRYRPYRAYTNYSAFGDMLYSHTDCAPDADEFTALWYLSERWDPEWGGETLFFDEGGDAQVVCSPRPGRLVIFHGAIRHAGRPPNRICVAARYTFAIKLEPVP